MPCEIRRIQYKETCRTPDARNGPAILRAVCQSLSLKACAGRPAAEESNQNDAASSAQVWQSDAKTNASAERPAATETNKNLDFQASAGRPAAEGSGVVNVDSVWPNNFQMSVDYVPHLEKVHSNSRKKIGRKSGDDMNDLDTNSLLWECLRLLRWMHQFILERIIRRNYVLPKVSHNER